MGSLQVHLPQCSDNTSHTQDFAYFYIFWVINLATFTYKEAETICVDIATWDEKMLYTERHAQYQCSLKFLVHINML